MSQTLVTCSVYRLWNPTQLCHISGLFHPEIFGSRNLDRNQFNGMFLQGFDQLLGVLSLIIPRPLFHIARCEKFQDIIGKPKTPEVPTLTSTFDLGWFWERFIFCAKNDKKISTGRESEISGLEGLSPKTSPDLLAKGRIQESTLFPQSIPTVGWLKSG